jgi:hypothetical protein
MHSAYNIDVHIYNIRTTYFVIVGKYIIYVHEL